MPGGCNGAAGAQRRPEPGSDRRWSHSARGCTCRKATPLLQRCSGSRVWSRSMGSGTAGDYNGWQLRLISVGCFLNSLVALHVGVQCWNQSRIKAFAPAKEARTHGAADLHILIFHLTSTLKPFILCTLQHLLDIRTPRTFRTSYLTMHLSFSIDES